MKSASTFGLCGLMLGFCASAAAVPTYTIKLLGLTDLEHTSDLGGTSSTLYGSNGAGQYVGASDRRNGGSSNLGHSSWFHDGISTIKIGLFDEEYTRSDGYQSSYGHGLNKAGQVIGESVRHGNTTGGGQSAWLYNGATTTVIGLTGPEHTGRNGHKHSTALHLNEAGQVVGRSERFNVGGQNLGTSAWQFDGGTTTVLGLTGPEHTRDDGYKWSLPFQQNASGQVIGSSDRYVGSIVGDGGVTPRGRSVWLYGGNSSAEIGLTSAEYATSNGYRSSSLAIGKAINSAGMAIGSSIRYNGGTTSFANTGWLFNGTATVPIGLTDSEHTNPSGAYYSSPHHLNDAAQAVGYSRRYVDGSSAGQTAWLYDGNATLAIGLSGSQYTSTSGQKRGETTSLNNAGDVVGRSYRYNGNVDIGWASWLYADGETKQIGPLGEEYVRYDGFTQTGSIRLNEAGQVAGSARRFYSGTAEHAVDSWFYDPELDETIVLPTPRRSNGDSWSLIGYLGDDGLILGYFNAYNAADHYIGDRAFYFTIEDGLHDLGPLVQGGLDENGWRSLADSFHRDESGRIAGHGLLANGSQMAYVLTPIPSLQGDFNGDGVVDAGDYTVWRDHLGGSFDLSGNGDESGASAGIVDAADYEYWKAHFGETARSGANPTPEFANAAVPEPSTLLLAVLGTIGLLIRRRL